MPTPTEYETAINDLMADNQDKDARLQQLSGQPSYFGGPDDDNLIKWQLDFKEDLDRIYHLLKGHQIKEDKETGNVLYVEPSDKNVIPFNNFGVQIIMNIMSFYLNRNTILSNYDDKMIEWKVYDFGLELADLIFNRYEDMMITIDKKNSTEQQIKDHLSQKIKMYPMIIKELVDTIHSAYLRAFNGGERESLRTARMVTQSEPLRGMNFPPQMMQQKKQNWWNPFSAGK